MSALNTALRGARIACCAGVLATWTLPSTANAQSRDPQARSMLRQALDDYQGGDVTGAIHRLRLALSGCGTSRCSTGMRASLHATIGAMQIAGQNDENRGMSEFRQALALSPDVRIDPSIADNHVNSAFDRARGNAGSQSGSDQGGDTESASGNEPPSVPSGAPRLMHTRLAEQLTNTPLPIYVEAPRNGSLGNARVEAHYRSNGHGWSSVTLDRVANGYGGEVPCTAMTDSGGVDYYVTATQDGSVVAAYGSPASPVHVDVVSERTRPAPALPGRMPPSTCGVGGRSGSNGNRQLGDPCETDSQCGEGLACREGACASAPAGGGGGAEASGGEAAGSSEPSTTYSFAIDVGGGVGLAYLTAGFPEYEEYREWDMPGSGNFTCGAPNSDGSPSRQCLPITSSGFAYEGFLYLGLRYNFLPRAGVGVSVRYQPDSANVGILSSWFFGLRLYYALNSSGFVKKGFSFAPYIGTGVGQMEASPPVAGSPPSAHVLSGLNNLHFGTHAEYGFGLLHAGVDVTFNFMIPNFLFVVDLQATLGVHF